MTRRLKSIPCLLIAVCLTISGSPRAAHASVAEHTEESASACITSSQIDEATADIRSATQADVPALQLDVECQLLQYVDETVFNASNHIARLPDEETLSTYVFLNEDGTKTVYYMDEETKYVAPDGTVREKNIDLLTTSAGYTTSQNDVTLSIPNDPSAGIGMSYAGYDIALIPQGGILSSAPQQIGNSIGYVNYYGKGTVLTYTPTLSGIKEDILLAAYTGVSSFTFLLNTDGLTLYQEDGRYYLATSTTAQLRIDLGDVVAYDATGRFSLGSMTAVTITAGQQYQLTICVDTAFLTDESTTYPVTIDPTLTVSDNTHGAGAIEDATVYEGKPTLNTGTWQYNHVGYYDSSYGIGRTVFRLTGLLADSGYSSASASDIQSATFYVREASGNSAATVYLYPMYSNTTWTETGITWNTLGTYIGIAYDTVSMESNALAGFNITEMLKDWKDGTRNPNAGFLLAGSTTNTFVKSLYSSEFTTTANRPYVVVTYTDSSTISIDQITMRIIVGNTASLNATTSPAGQTITWESSDKSVATVSNTGYITALKIGTTLITASLANGASDICLIRVTLEDGIYSIKSKSTNLCLGTYGVFGTARECTYLEIHHPI